MKRLLWKEYRENWYLPVLIGIGYALWYRAGWPKEWFNNPGEQLALLYVTWVIAGLLVGAGLVSREVGSGTLQFLLALPISRKRIWWVKLLAGLLLLMSSMALTSVSWWLMYGRPGIRSAFWRSQVTPEAFLIAAVGTLGLSLLCSTLLDRAVSAVLVAIIAVVAVSLPLNAFASAYFSPLDFDGAVPIYAFIPALFAAGFATFTRGETLRTRTAFDQVAECALLNGKTVDLIRTKTWDTNMDMAQYERDKAAVAGDWNALKATLAENTAKVIAAIQAVPDEDLGIQVQMPWSSMSLAEIIAYPYWNMSYHQGQINYIASMLGCLN